MLFILSGDDIAPKGARIVLGEAKKYGILL